MILLLFKNKTMIAKDILSNIPRNIPRNIHNNFFKEWYIQLWFFCFRKQNNDTYGETSFKLKMDIQWISIELLECVQKIFLTFNLPFFEGYPSKNGYS